MKHRLKGLLALVLSLTMVFALATNAWAVTATSVKIGSSVTLDSTKPYWKNGDTTATASANDYNAYFDAATHTLTLNGANIGNTYYGYGISANGDLTINLIGDNTVTHNDSGGIAAIHVDGDLTIKEGRDDGSLTASDTGTNFDGILASGKVTIESGKVTATGGKYGLSASNVNIEGGTVTATATGNKGRGIYTKEGYVTISGGTVEATGRDSGILADKVTISGGTVTAGSATDDGIGDVIYNSAFGIKADSSISITGGTVTATGSDAIAINEDTTTGTISISGATTTVTANGGNSGIYAKGSVTIAGGSVLANSTNDDGWGIYGGSTITIGNNEGTTSPTVTVGCATGLKADIVNITGGSTVSIEASSGTSGTVAKAINSNTLNMGGNWYQWSTDNTNFTDSNTSELTNVIAKGTATLYIKPITYTVAFNANGHGTAPSAQSGIAAGGKVTEPNPAPTAAGWTFGGWYEEQSCTSKWDFANDTVTTDITLYAKWTENSTGGPSTQQPSYNYPIYIPTVEDEPEVTTPDTFDGGIASAVVVTILSATGGAWLAKKKD